MMQTNLLQDLLRQRGRLGRFAANETLPTRKAEAWKYTDLKRLETVGWTVADAAQSHGLETVPEGLPGLENALDIVVVNGVLDTKLSRLSRLPKGFDIDVVPASEAWGEGFTDRISDALTQDEIRIYVHAGTVIETPIHIRYVTWGEEPSSAIAHAARVSITLEEHARATIVESHVTAQGMGFAIPSLGVSLAPLAHLGLYSFLHESSDSVQLGLIDIGLSKQATLDSFTLSVGGGLMRRETRLSMAGERSEASLSGAYIGSGNAIIDTTTLVTHSVENATSCQFFQGVLDDHARGVFQGKVLVCEGARGTDGQQKHRALLLSDTAEVDAKPELEIYADDVQCAHGATVGSLDQNQLFYLRARGIPEMQARSVLTESFLAEAVEKIASEKMRPVFQSALDQALGRGMA